MLRFEVLLLIVAKGKVDMDFCHKTITHISILGFDVVTEDTHHIVEQSDFDFKVIERQDTLLGAIKATFGIFVLRGKYGRNDLSLRVKHFGSEADKPEEQKNNG